MSETFPRWNLPEVKFLETDAEKIKAEAITTLEKATGRVFAAGDPVRLVVLALADEIIRLRGAVNLAAQQNLLTYARGRNLDALGVLLDTYRLPASRAVTTIRFTLSQVLGSVYTIPAGTEVSNGVVTFATSETVEIPIGSKTAEVSAECTTAGAIANGYLPGQLTALVKPMVFIESVTNTTPTTGGADVESDADYAERIRIAPNTFSVAGPRKAYIYHARSVIPSIVDVAVDSPEPGEVHIYPLMENGELPSSEVLQKVEAHLSADDIRPLTDHVTAKKPNAVNYEIEVHYWISREDSIRAAQRQADVTEAVNQYKLWQQARIGRDIAPEKLVQMVVSAGAIRVDHAHLKPANFQVLDKVSVAQCTRVNLVYEGYKDE